MKTARVDQSYMALINRFPLVHLRDQSHFADAVQIMKELAYRRSTLTDGETDYLNVLGDLIAQYEQHLPKIDDRMAPREALLYLMEINQLAQSDLVEFVGYKSNLSAFLNGRRGLSKRAAARLASYFKVSATLFLDLE